MSDIHVMPYLTTTLQNKIKHYNFNLK